MAALQPDFVFVLQRRIRECPQGDWVNFWSSAEPRQLGSVPPPWVCPTSQVGGPCRGRSGVALLFVPSARPTG